MTIVEMRKRLEELEGKGYGDFPVTIEVSNQHCKVDSLKVEEVESKLVEYPDGWQASAPVTSLVIVPVNNLWFA